MRAAGRRSHGRVRRLDYGNSPKLKYRRGPCLVRSLPSWLNASHELTRTGNESVRRKKSSVGWRRWSNEYLYGVLDLYWDWKTRPLSGAEECA